MAHAATASTRVARVFLGWSCPALDAIAEWLSERMGLTSLLPADDEPLVVVLPGARAARMVLARLVRAADARGVPLRVPTIVTPGSLPDALLGPAPGRAAGTIERRLAWVRAMRLVAPEVLAIVAPAPPTGDDLPAWLGIAGLLDRAHVELAAEGLCFADVVSRAQSRGVHAEGDRWRALGAIQAEMESCLHGAGLIDPERARADRRPCPGAAVVLAGVPELGAVARRALEGARVTSLVLAPRELRDAFDELGCVRPGSFDAFPAPTDDAIRFADGPHDQARVALDAIAALAARSDDVVVGVPDPALAPLLERGARRRGARLRNAAGAPARLQPPLRLLRRVAAHLGSPSASTLADLLIHPTIDRWLTRRTGERGWASALDRHRARHLIIRLDAGPASGAPRRVRLAIDRIDGLLAPLASREPSPIGALASAVLDALAEIHAGVPLDPDRPGEGRELGALGAIRDAAAALAQAPESLSARTTGADAATIIADIAAEGWLAGDPDPRAIEMVGWLELGFDPAPSAVVVGLNEGVIPRRGSGDPLLPDRLREALGMPCDRSRLARDAYLLALACAPWRRHRVLIAGRRSRAGEPTWPSRLLLRGSGADAARRLRRFQAASAPPTHRPGSRPSRRAIAPDEPVRSMSVTSFRAYLASPYQFYLERVLGLRDDDESARELGPAWFGSLIHDALDAHAKGPDARDGDPARTRSALREHLRRLAIDALGHAPPPAARVQLALAESRLDAAADWLAARVRDGWELLAPGEWAPAEPVHLDHELGRTRVTGRIDRIERHPRRGVVAILDYKTSAGGLSPERSHRRAGRWIDLQLPLYVLLSRELVGDAAIELGYVPISGRGRVGEALASWSRDDLHDALTEARRIAAAVWRGEFDEIGEPSGRSALSLLCAPEAS